MFAKRYGPDDLIDILGAASYEPNLVSTCRQVESDPHLSIYLSKKPSLGVTGTIAKDYVAADTPKAIPYITTKQVKGLHTYLDDVKYISAAADAEWEKCRVDDGDIVINKSGNVGAAAVLRCSPYAYVNSVSDIINIKIADGAQIDKEFLVVYLNSKWGQGQLRRLSGGAIFDHVSLHAIPNINVPSIDLIAQEYIGDKVRQAEQLRVWASKCFAGAQFSLPQHHNSIPHSTKKSYRTTTGVLSSDRLDPQFYHPNQLALEESISKAQASKLEQHCKKVTDTWKKTSEKFVYYEIGSLNTVDGTILGEITATIDAPSRATTKVTIGDILVSTVRPNRKNVALVYDEFDALQRVATSGFTVLRFPDLETAVLFHTWLRSDDATQQLLRWNTGSAYPAIDENVPLVIKAPNFEDEFRKTWGPRLANGFKAMLAARCLNEAAKLLVEALIDGKLLETDLEHARLELDTGNRATDRSILNRLAKSGMDESGDKLFPELSDLYDLLGMIEKDEENQA